MLPSNNMLPEASVEYMVTVGEAQTGVRGKGGVKETKKKLERLGGRYPHTH